MALFTTKFNGLKASLKNSFDHRPAYRYAQILLLLVLVSITRSPPLTSLFELGLVLLFLFSADLRRALQATLRDIRVILLVVFFAWVGISVLWSPVDLDLRLDKWWSWRKVLYLPMAMAVFADPRSKLLPIWTIILTAGVYVILSWGAHFGYWSLWAGPSWLIRNHSTQGVFFSFAAFLSCYLVLRHSVSYWLMSALMLLVVALVSNQLLVLTGRTGYVTLLVLSLAGAWYFTPKYKLALTALAGIAVMVGLAMAPTASSRIELAINNALNAYDDSSCFSSLGIRVVFWNNGLELIKQRQILGTGADGIKFRYAELVEDQSGWRAQVTDDLHQQYLNIAVEFGLVGLLVFSGLLIACLLTDFRLQPLVFLGFALAASYLANGLANGHFNGFTEGRMIWVFWGAMMSGVPLYRIGHIGVSYQ